MILFEGVGGLIYFLYSGSGECLVFGAQEGLS